MDGWCPSKLGSVVLLAGPDCISVRRHHLGTPVIHMRRSVQCLNTLDYETTVI